MRLDRRILRLWPHATKKSASALTLATSGLLSVGFSSVCTARTFLASCRRLQLGTTRDGSIGTLTTCREANCVAGSLMRIDIFILLGLECNGVRDCYRISCSSARTQELDWTARHTK